MGTIGVIEFVLALVVFWLAVVIWSCVIKPKRELAKLVAEKEAKEAKEAAAASSQEE